MKIFIPTIGTRGDVQPYVALGVGFRRAGHEVTLATAADFDEFVTNAGLTHATISGSFLEYLKPDAPKPNPREVARTTKREAPQALLDEWEAAQGSDVVVYNPASWGGFHIAEKLNVPGFAVYPTPMYTPTSEYPSPFLPFNRLGPLNKASHRLYMKLGPILFRKPIAEWRRDILGLPKCKSEWRRDGQDVTRLYGYSPAVVPPSKDWNDSSVVTGYWFYEEQEGWEPPSDLEEFLGSGPPPVFVGFGSMIWGKAETQLRLIIEALNKAGRRGIVQTAWQGTTPGIQSSDLYVTRGLPHGWLFPKVSAIVHHGGAGTTGASLRAGKPTIICPFITDQRFWGKRVHELGAGPAPIRQRKLTADNLAAALVQAHEPSIVARAEQLGEQIQREDGVGAAVSYVLERAQSWQEVHA